MFKNHREMDYHPIVSPNNHLDIFNEHFLTSILHVDTAAQQRHSDEHVCELLKKIHFLGEKTPYSHSIEMFQSGYLNFDDINDS